MSDSTAQTLIAILLLPIGVILGLIIMSLLQRTRYLLTVRWSALPPTGMSALSWYDPRFAITHTVKQGESFPMPQINVEHPGLLAEVTLKTAAGNPAPWDEQPTFSVDVDDVVSVDQEATGTDATARCRFRPLPLPEGVDAHTCQVTLEGDADLGSGVRPVIATGTITVTAAEGVFAEITFTELPGSNKPQS